MMSCHNLAYIYFLAVNQYSDCPEYLFLSLFLHFPITRMAATGPARHRGSIMTFDSSSVLGEYKEEVPVITRKESVRRASIRSDPGTRQSFKEFRFLLSKGGDWTLLGIVSITMALISYLLESLARYGYVKRDELLSYSSNTFIKFAIWTAFPIVLIITATFIVRLIAPNSAGSGVAEMKVILRGAVLKEYLSLSTLFAKLISLPLVIGSGLPLGKDGACVHISSIITRQLVKFRAQEAETKLLELLAVACAVGISSSK